MNPGSIDFRQNPAEVFDMALKDKKLFSFLLWAFGIAWVLQVVAGIMYRSGNAMLFSVLLSVTMFAPLIAVLLSRIDLKQMGWKPRIRGNVKYILAAWFGPALLGTAGAVLYFLLFPEAFDSAFADRIASAIGEEGIARLEATGLSIPAYIIINIVASLIYAPWLNMFFALGEEAGWRGAMYPVLREHFGTAKGRIVGGIIWGAWHWPIMILAGYEYGTSYWGAPVTGPLLFCVIATAMGILLDWVYEKTNCIWIPSLGHGAINAFAGIPALFLKPEYSNNLLVGPLMVGIIGGLPMILAAVLVSVKSVNRDISAGNIS